MKGKLIKKQKSCVHVCVYMFVCVYVCVCLCVPVFVCMCVYCMSVCMCVCMYKDTHKIITCCSCSCSCYRCPSESLENNKKWQRSIRQSRQKRPVVRLVSDRKPSPPPRTSGGGGGNISGIASRTY